jgi:GNAT superfamily N-acetyltransferase
LHFLYFLNKHIPMSNTSSPEHVVNVYTEVPAPGQANLELYTRHGYLNAASYPDHRFEIECVEVDPDFRRLRIATTLLRHATAQAVQYGADSMSSTITSSDVVGLMSSFFGNESVFIDADSSDTEAVLAYDMPHKLPVQESSIDTPFEISEFDPAWGIAPADIAAMHLALREWQEQAGQNKAKGFKRIRLSTGRMEKALPIYRYFGFGVVDYIPDHDDWAMELDLGNPAQP